jgi:hypothetical protein
MTGRFQKSQQAQVVYRLKSAKNDIDHAERRGPPFSVPRCWECLHQALQVERFIDELGFGGLF